MSLLALWYLFPARRGARQWNKPKHSQLLEAAGPKQDGGKQCFLKSVGTEGS